VTCNVASRNATSCQRCHLHSRGLPLALSRPRASARPCTAAARARPDAAGVYVDEGPDRDALTEALGREHYVPVYLDPKTARAAHPPPLRARCPACARTTPARARQLCLKDAARWCSPGSRHAHRGAPAPRGAALRRAAGDRRVAGSLTLPYTRHAGGPALQRLLQQRAVAAVPLRAAQHRQQAERDAHAAVPVGRPPGAPPAPGPALPRPRTRARAAGSPALSHPYPNPTALRRRPTGALARWCCATTRPATWSGCRTTT